MHPYTALMKYVLLLAAVALLSCESQQEKLARLWFFTHQTTVAGKRNVRFPATSFLLLQKDGRFTRDFGDFQHGTWKFADEKLMLDSDNRLVSEYAAVSDGTNLRLTAPDGMEGYFEAQPVKAGKEEANPFALSNSKWRIKANQKESDAELIERLKNHLVFWEAYFTWAYENELNSIDVRSLPTPIKMYSNGFKVKPPEDLRKNWIKLFYDSSDCLRASDLLEQHIKRTSITFPRTDHKFKMFVGVFQQLNASKWENDDIGVRP
jgi:hypothetical protein